MYSGSSLRDPQWVIPSRLLGLVNPRGTRASNLEYYGNGEEEAGPSVGDPTQEINNDADSQKAGLTLLRLLRSEHEGGTKEEVWQGFIFALSASGDLLTALNRCISHPLSEDVKTLSMQGVESVYRELEVIHWGRSGPEVASRITKMVTEGLLSTVLIITLLYIKDEGPLTDTDMGDLLLSLSLNAQITHHRVREELSRAVHILEEGRTKRIYDRGLK